MECPYKRYGGESWGEDFYECSKTNLEVPHKGIAQDCPYKKS